MKIILIEKKTRKMISKMAENNTLTEIAKEFLNAENVLIFPHVNPDGDALGSSVSLCLALRKLGKSAYVLTDEALPGYLSFLGSGCCVRMDSFQSSKGTARSCEACEGLEPAVKQDLPELVFTKLFGGKEPDISACVDCADVSRIEARKDMFFAGKKKICIDHHATGKPIADLNFIDGSIAAASEISYSLICEMEKISGKQLIDKELGSVMYAGICTDTGNFQYSNTTHDTFRIAMELLERGVQPSKISVELYQNVKLSRLLISAESLSNLQIFAGGRAAMSFVSRKMLQKTGASMDETDGIVESLRSIAGVEVAVFLKENGPCETKVSTRAKSFANVAEICAKFDGGGHIRAAGCTIHEPLEKAIEIMKKEVEEYLDK